MRMVRNGSYFDKARLAEGVKGHTIRFFRGWAIDISTMDKSTEGEGVTSYRRDTLK
jgi:hypothetical protein